VCVCACVRVCVCACVRVCVCVSVRLGACIWVVTARDSFICVTCFILRDMTHSYV